jgi:hypothetical protein
MGDTKAFANAHFVEAIGLVLKKTASLKLFNI